MKKPCSMGVLFLWQIRCLPRLAKLTFRQAFGRWYIFRDEPDWIVRTCRSFRHSQEEDVRSFGVMANEEWKLRRRRRALLGKDGAP